MLAALVKWVPLAVPTGFQCWQEPLTPLSLALVLLESKVLFLVSTATRREKSSLRQGRHLSLLSVLLSTMSLW